MSDETPAITEFRRVALRIVAATEYFKASGDLPAWARAELDSWDEPRAAGTEPAPPVSAVA